MQLNKGDRVRIEGNSILADCMGIPIATGTVFLVHGKGFAFKCDQTGAMERCDFGDGKITVE